MKRILFVTPQIRGHINPFIPVAQWLMRNGFHVGWSIIEGEAKISAQLAAMGIEPVEAVWPVGPTKPFARRQSQELSGIYADLTTKGDLLKKKMVGDVHAQLEPFSQAVDAFRPDLIAGDSYAYLATIVAQQRNLPYVSLAPGLTPVAPLAGRSWPVMTLAAHLAPERQQLFDGLGLRAQFKLNDALSPLLTIVFTTPEFVGKVGEVPPGTRLVGPSVPLAARGDESEFPWEQIDATRRLIYASFGSMISWQPNLFRAIAGAVSSLGEQAVLAAGDLVGTNFEDDLPPRTIVRSYVPQHAVLERAAALISHGGANSVMEAMWHGVPTIVIPMGQSDQSLNAFFLKSAGAGLEIDREAATLERIKEALIELRGCEAGARRIRDSYRAHDGAQEAARLIGALLA